MSISQKYSNSYPSLYLNFAQSGQLDPRVSIARTSTGTYIDAEGIVRTAGPNEPRFNYENGECKGLLVEGQKTNSYLYNGGASQYQYRFINNEVGVWQNALGVSSDNTAFNGSSATVTTDLPGGIIGTAARATLTGSNGNASFQFDGIGYNVSVLSTFIRANKNCTIGWGTENNFLYFDLIANEWKRVYAFLSSTPWSSAVRLMRANDRVSNIDGGYPVTFDFSFVQQEEGSSLTSYIPTSGSAVTRAPDKVTINDLSWFDDYEGTFVVDTDLIGVTTTTTLFSIDNGSSQILYNGSKVKVGTGKTIYNPILTSDDTQRIVGYSSSKNIVVSSSSKESAFFSTTTSLPTGMNRLAIGWDPLNSNNYLNGPIKSLRYYPTLLDDNQLKTLIKINQDQTIEEVTTSSYSGTVGIATTGLVLNLDVGISTSYVGTGVTWYDLSGNNNNGTLVNGVGYGSTQGGYLTFDGSNDYVNCPITKSATCTFSCWAKTTTVAGTPMLFNAGPSSVGPDLFFYNGKIIWNTWDADANPFASTPVSVTDGNWHYYVVVNDASTNTKLYYDGVLLGTAVYKNASANTNLTIGGNTDTYQWNGNICNFTLHNRALTATEVLQNYNATKSRFITGTVNNYYGLVLSLDASDPSSYSPETNTWYDLSGRGNNGTLTNGPTYSSSNGGYIVFDGVNDYIDCGPVSVIGSSLTGLTVNVWVNPSVKDVKCIAENGTNYTTNTFYMFQENADYFTFAVYGTTYDVVYANFKYQTNTWYNLTGVWSSNNRVELYCNGVLCSGSRGGSVQSSLINGNTNLLIGSRNYGSYPFSGKIPQVLIYNRALTATEIQQNFNALRGRFGI